MCIRAPKCAYVCLNVFLIVSLQFPIRLTLYSLYAILLYVCAVYKNNRKAVNCKKSVDAVDVVCVRVGVI